MRDFADDADRDAPHSAQRPGLVFTYSRPEQPLFRRTLIRAVEALTGSGVFERAYRRWRRAPQPTDARVFATGLAALGVTVQASGAGAQAIPRDGGVLVIANHPFGILDGLAVGAFVSEVRPDAKLMVHSLLCQPAEARDVLLPVDFGAGAEARRTTAATRKQAVDWLDAGHVLVIFPAGSISTAPRPFDSVAVDCDWHPFVARLAARRGVRVVPMFVRGQNSRLFQIVSHLSYPLRIALVFHETRRLLRQPVRLTVGQAFAPILDAGDTKADLTQRLRQITYGLAGVGGPDPSRAFVWPPYIRW